jgi:hypothetical protein
MHARDLVDVAALVALNGPALAHSGRVPQVAYLEQYWATSKNRFDSWNRVMKTCGVLGNDGDDGIDEWLQLRATLDEIFISEMLTRVWSAVLVACDQRLKSNTAEPIARSVMATHLEARRRALELLMQGGAPDTRQAVAVNRLRRRAERWTDVLVGGLWRLGDLGEFAIEPERAEDFAIDLATRGGQPGGPQAWRLTLVSLRNAFQAGLTPVSANPEANGRITASILGCLPSELFDSTGLCCSLWMMRMSANASDAQGLIGDLLQSNLPAARPQPVYKPKRRT